MGVDEVAIIQVVRRPWPYRRCGMAVVRWRLHATGSPGGSSARGHPSRSASRAASNARRLRAPPGCCAAGAAAVCSDRLLADGRHDPDARMDARAPGARHRPGVSRRDQLSARPRLPARARGVGGARDGRPRRESGGAQCGDQAAGNRGRSRGHCDCLGDGPAIRAGGPCARILAAVCRGALRVQPRRLVRLGVLGADGLDLRGGPGWRDPVDYERPPYPGLARARARCVYQAAGRSARPGCRLGHRTRGRRADAGHCHRGLRCGCRAPGPAVDRQRAIQRGLHHRQGHGSAACRR